jgi:threonine synthase
MQFKSTRDESLVYTFEEAVLAGWAEDGGMIVPKEFPQIDAAKLEAMYGMSYNDVCFEVMRMFCISSPASTSGMHEIEKEKEPDLDETMLRNIIDESFSVFAIDEIVKTVTIKYPQNDAGVGSSELLVYELWHGPTLAFKDLGMQFLARMLNYYLKKRNEKKIILVGTSGDTGSSACEALAGLKNIELFVLYPGVGRISDVQELQMIRCKADDAEERYKNIHIIAVGKKNVM